MKIQGFFPINIDEQTMVTKTPYATIAHILCVYIRFCYLDLSYLGETQSHRLVRDTIHESHLNLLIVF